MQTVIDAFPQLKELTLHQQERISKLFTRREVKKLETLLKEDEIETSVIIIETGVFRHVRASGKVDTCVGLFRPGQIVSNYLSWLYGSASSFRIEALTPGSVWELTDGAYHDLSDLADLQKELRRLLAEQMCTQSLKNSIELARSQHTMECYEYLIRQESYILMHTPLMYMADFLGVTQSTLSRIRRDMMVKEKSLNTK